LSILFGAECTTKTPDLLTESVDGKMKTIEVIGYLAAQGIRVLLADAFNRWRWLGQIVASKTFQGCNHFTVSHKTAPAIDLSLVLTEPTVIQVNRSNVY
jgi:hypothetical protein